MEAPKNLKSPLGIILGSLKGSTPKNTGVNPRIIIISPRVIICFATGEAFFACLIIKISIITPMIIAVITPPISARYRGTPNLSKIEVTIKVLNIPITPWEKFVTLEVLNTIIIPKAARAYILPVSKLLKITCKKVLI